MKYRVTTEYHEKYIVEVEADNLAEAIAKAEDDDGRVVNYDKDYLGTGQVFRVDENDNETLVRDGEDK